MKYLSLMFMILFITACSEQESNHNDKFIGFLVEGGPDYKHTASIANLVEISKQGDNYFINENYVYGNGQTIAMRKLTKSQDNFDGLAYPSERNFGLENKVTMDDDTKIGIFNTHFFRISKEEAEHIKRDVKECEEIEKNRFFIPNEQQAEYKKRAKELAYCRIFW